MSIQVVAQELIDLRNRTDELSSQLRTKRNEMYNELANQPNLRFEYQGYRFIRTEDVTVRYVTKKSVMEALQDEDLTQEVLHRIIGAAMLENERFGGIRMSPIRREEGI